MWALTIEHLTCPTTPEAWKELGREFRLRWDVPHALGALDGKHMRIKKPPKSGSLYHNYKGIFSVILMALVDTEYRMIQMCGYWDRGVMLRCRDLQH